MGWLLRPVTGGPTGGRGLPTVQEFGNQILLVFVDGCCWTEAASGAAGRANVEL